MMTGHNSLRWAAMLAVAAFGWAANAALLGAEPGGSRVSWLRINHRAVPLGTTLPRPLPTESLASYGLRESQWPALVNFPSAGSRHDRAHPAATEVFRDSFDDPSSGWPTGENEIAKAEYLSGEYHLRLKEAGWSYASINGQIPSVAQFGVTVRARASTGMRDRAYGIVFGYSSGTGDSSGYAYYVDPWDGTFSLQEHVVGQARENSLIDWTPAAAIQRDSVANVLRVERRGDALRLLVNDTLLTTYIAPEVRPREFGVIAANFEDPAGVDLYFDDFAVESFGDEVPPTATQARTVTPTPRVSATPRPTMPLQSPTPPIPEPPLSGWNLIHRDDFELAPDAWPEGNGPDGGAIGRVAGEYRMRLPGLPNVTQVTFADWPVPLGNFSLQVSAHLVDQASQAGYGIAWGGRQFRFFVDPLRGSFSLQKWDGQNPAFVFVDVTSPAIQRGNATNVIRVERIGPQLRFFVNGELVRTHVDPDITAGLPSLYFRNHTDAMAEARFDDFRYYTPHRDALPTAAVSATPRLATASPSPSATDIRIRVPTNTPRPTGPAVLLPILARSIARQDLPPSEPRPPGRIDITFGAGVTSQGMLLEPGTTYQFGLMSLMCQIKYSAMEPGTTLAWEWRYNGEIVAVDELHDARDVTAADGTLVMGVAMMNGAALPLGSYEVRTFLGPRRVLAAAAQARIQANPPAGATARLPTMVPTVAATAPATPTPPAGSGCRTLFANPGFELGPRDWRVYSTAPIADALDITRVIRRGLDLVPPRRPPEGEWLARFGGGRMQEEHLLPEGPPIALWPAEQLVLARLSYDYWSETTHPADTVASDWLTPNLINQDNTDAVMPGGAVTENHSQDERWHTSGPIDVTPWFTRRPGWTGTTVRFVTVSGDDADETIFYVDRIQLEVCLAAATQARQFIAVLGGLPASTTGPNGISHEVSHDARRQR